LKTTRAAEFLALASLIGPNWLKIMARSLVEGTALALVKFSTSPACSSTGGTLQVRLSLGVEAPLFAAGSSSTTLVHVPMCEANLGGLPLPLARRITGERDICCAARLMSNPIFVICGESSKFPDFKASSTLSQAGFPLALRLDIFPLPVPEASPSPPLLDLLFLGLAAGAAAPSMPWK
jgi:hypothetical protein